MATLLTVSKLPGQNALTGVAVTMAAADNAAGNVFPSTGSEIVIVYNSSNGALTFTITGVNDPYGRGISGGNFSMSVPATASLTAPSIIMTPRLAQYLWANGGNVFVPTGVSASLFIGVITGT